MDAWGWQQLEPWLRAREEMPVGALFCVIDGPSRGQPWSAAAVRVQLRQAAAGAGVRRRLRRTSSAMPTPLKWVARASFLS